MVTFHQQNIMDVESLEQCDLALCRNTLIYFTRPDQEKILRGIAHILPAGGILVLGKSETLVGDVRRLFTTVCPVERIYRKI
jgi:chemotaxis protein methyltransferase CheR